MNDGKICSKCKEYKIINDFVKDKRRSNGIGSTCRKCQYRSSRKWLVRVLSDPIFKQEYNKRQAGWRRSWSRKPENIIKAKIFSRSTHRKEWRKENRMKRKNADPIRCFIRETIGNHRKKYEILFTAEELLLLANDPKCSCCGILFADDYWSRRSLDRIDGLYLGLKISDVRVICMRCNTMKGNMTSTEFIDRCHRIYEYSLK